MRAPIVAFLAVAVLAVAGVGGWVAADRLMGDDDGAATATPTRTGTATPSTSATAVAGGPALLVREFASGADTLWVAPAASPADRKSVAQVDHDPDWGVMASLSPDGNQLAYLVLTSGSQDPGREAQAWVLDVRSGEKRHLADGFDLRTRPVWSAGSGAIVVGRNGPQTDTGGEISLVSIDVSDGSEDVLHTEPNVLGLFPIGYSSAVGDALVYARITISGTDLGWLGRRPPGPPVHVSNESARDWHLSPDETQLTFLARQRTDGRIATRAFVTELGGEAEAALVLSAAPEAVDQFNPVWRDENTVTVGRTPAEGEATAPALSVSLEGDTPEAVEPGPEQGFDVPVAWSADGRYLVVRSFEGSSAAEAGRESLTVIEEGVGRNVIGGEGNLEFIGWLSSGSR